MTLTDKQREDVLEALDVLGVLLAKHGHVWAQDDRRRYERAVRILGESPKTPGGAPR